MYVQRLVQRFYEYFASVSTTSAAAFTSLVSTGKMDQQQIPAVPAEFENRVEEFVKMETNDGTTIYKWGKTLIGNKEQWEQLKSRLEER